MFYESDAEQTVVVQSEQTVVVQSCCLSLGLAYFSQLSFPLQVISTSAEKQGHFPLPIGQATKYCISAAPLLAHFSNLSSTAVIGFPACTYWIPQERLWSK